jgi:hypothetical protein
MTPEQASTFKEYIIAAIEKQLAEGGRILSCAFGGRDYAREDDPTPPYCPVACLIGGALTGADDGSYHDKVSETLGFEISCQELWSFIYAFDDHPQPSGMRDEAMAAVGTELRAIYITKENKNDA